MPKQRKAEAVEARAVEGMIFVIRDQKVMLDRDLADLYGVETAQLKRQVKRNIDRFPNDFMFVLNKAEFENWRCQFGTSNKIRMGLRYAPMAFTEHGILMLSSVLNSERAIQVNIMIMRTFSRLREMVSAHKELAHKMKELERKVGRHDEEINVIIDVIKRLMRKPQKQSRPIGFHVR